MEAISIADAREATLALLNRRASEATICPSEVARALAPMAWRDMMPMVHAAVDELVHAGLARLSWKGRAVPSRTGPYRIRRGDGIRLPA
ncbi:DUF3253 domain-containing protein [Sphingomonas bacterium]|uniref:DUF3253 domain-containing protein n=1 Tax=Sphingomonas bacterium TaxID=1895847 RepID=UPI0015759227|nr:DUF3253 domain-containing protein [Sphingomonas bacterium]